MNRWFFKTHDLVSPDGKITSLKKLENGIEAVLYIEGISPNFRGFLLDSSAIFFNLKSTLAQIGVDSETLSIQLNQKTREAFLTLRLFGIGDLASLMLNYIEVGDFIGKLFIFDEERRVRDPDYLMRMFGRADRKGRPLLSFGDSPEKEPFQLEKKEGRVIAFIPLKKGVFEYSKDIQSFLPTIAKGLKDPYISLRNLLRLYQNFNEEKLRKLEENELLLVRTSPLHIRTVFGKVVDEYLPKGFKHTKACVLQPDTHASGDIYELYGSSIEEIEFIPLEFYTLSPYKEHVFFHDRDQLQSCIENPKCLFDAFDTAPHPLHHKAAVFVVKGEQLLNLKKEDWITSESDKEEFPKEENPERMALMIDKYVKKQPSYPFLEAIEHNEITSQGILLSRYFPSPRMKKLLISDHVQANLKGIYFQYPSRSFGIYFSHEDRSFLNDLARLCIPVFWVDRESRLLLKYVMKPEKDAGMFVPLPQIATFTKATTIGVYGSNLLEGNFIDELKKLLQGLKDIKADLDHPFMNANTPLALVTGGGPGAMMVGNKVATDLEILSCANLVDFSKGAEGVLNEQHHNPYVQAKMTYRLDRLVERQAEFHLDLPIFLMGGIGTDFEFALEEVRRKVGIIEPFPVLLFGTKEYWEEKITSRFQCNLQSGTIKGSEWISSCFYVVKNADEGIKIYRKYFSNQLKINKDSPIRQRGFALPEEI